MICMVVYRRCATVERGPYTDKLFSSHVEVAPRPGDYICINADDASLFVDKIEFDYTTKPTTAMVYVK